MKKEQITYTNVVEIKFYFLVYDDNCHNNYLNKLLESVKKYDKKFEIIKFNKNDIDTEFIKKNKHILSLKRGDGYWLWKPYIINNILHKINNDDIIFYMDSKYYFIQDFENLYLEYMKNNDILVWKNKPNEPCYLMKQYCKMDLVLKYNMYKEVFVDNVIDCWAGALIVKKNLNTIKYIQEWFDACSVFENITDSKSNIINSNEFIEHRHDQSCLSIILHKYKIPIQFFEKKYLQNSRCPFTI
jgi:hypothetical protein